MALDLAINDLDAGYGAVKALRGVSLRVAAGETVALLGTNGNGKSTLMKCIAGLVRPQRGSISLTIDGVVHDLSRLSTEEIVELGVVMVPEGRRLFPRLTVLENLQMGAFTRSEKTHAAQRLDQIAGFDGGMVRRALAAHVSLNRWRARPRDRTPRPL